jgi:hypothetical protein
MHFGVMRRNKGHRPGDKPAQANALGKCVAMKQAPKGRNNVRRPFRTSLSFAGSQGVGLGWLAFASLVPSGQSRKVHNTL